MERQEIEELVSNEILKITAQVMVLENQSETKIKTLEQKTKSLEDQLQ